MVAPNPLDRSPLIATISYMVTIGGVLLLGYRESKELSRRKMGLEIGVSATSCHEWDHGTRRPSKKRAVKIEEVTGGAVPAASWLEPVAHQSVSPESIPGVPC